MSNFSWSKKSANLFLVNLKKIVEQKQKLERENEAL